MQYSLFGDILGTFRNLSELIQVITIISTAMIIVTVIICAGWFLVKLLDSISKAFYGGKYETDKSQQENLKENLGKLDQVIYELITQYELPETIAEKDKIYLKIILQRFREGAVIVEFIIRNKK